MTINSSVTSMESVSTSEGVTLDTLTHEDALYLLNSEMRAAVLWVTIYVGIEAVLGFLGNLLVLYVFACRYHVCIFRYFVLCLASIDFISCMTTVPGEVVSQLYWYTYPSRTLCKVKSFFNVFTISAEAFCLFTIAVDRYRKVCRPFGKQITPKTAKLLCGLIYLSAIAVGLPTAIFWGTQTTQRVYMGRTVYVTVCEKDEDYMQSPAPLEYITITEVIVAIILGAMFVLYALVARQLILNKSKLEQDFERSTYRRRRTRADQGTEASSTDGISSTDSKTPGSSSMQPKSSSKDKETFSESNVDQAAGNPNDIDFKTKTKDTEYRQAPHRMTIHRRKVTIRVRRKTKIMLFLTVSFFITTILYLTLLDIIARQGEELDTLTFNQKAVYFFFFRCVFINHVINAWIYGFWDTRFKKVVREMKHRLLCCR